MKRFLTSVKVRSIEGMFLKTTGADDVYRIHNVALCVDVFGWGNRQLTANSPFLQMTAGWRLCSRSFEWSRWVIPWAPRWSPCFWTSVPCPPRSEAHPAFVHYCHICICWNKIEIFIPEVQGLRVNLQNRLSCSLFCVSLQNHRNFGSTHDLLQCRYCLSIYIFSVRPRHKNM